MGSWTAGGCASRRSARSGSRRWSTSSSCADSSTPTSTPTTGSPGRCSARCRCSCSACGCSRCRRRGSPCSSRSGATAMLVGSAYETFVHLNLEILTEPWFPLVNMLGLTADAVATSTLLSRVRDLPRPASPSVGGSGSRSSSSGLPVLVGPLTLLTTPHVVMSQFIGISGDVDPQPVSSCRGSSGRRPPSTTSSSSPGRRSRSALAVLASRALFGDARGARPHPRHGLAVAAAMVAFVLWTFVPGLWGIEFLVYASMIAIPVAAIHGILRYGAFDIGPGDRGARVERSSNLLITVVYAAGVATPAAAARAPAQDRAGDPADDDPRRRAAAGARLDAAAAPPRPVRRPRAPVHDAERARRAARTGRRPARAAHPARRGGA